MTILVLVEQRAGELKKPSLEVLGEARRQADQHGDQVFAMVLGTGVDQVVEQVRTAGAHKLLVADSPILSKALPCDLAKDIAQAIEKYSIEAVWLSATAVGRELGATIAIDHDTCSAADCVSVERTDKGYRVQRPIYAGKAIQTVELTHTPAVISIRPNQLAPLEKPTEAAETESWPTSLTDSNVKAQIVEVVAEAGRKVGLVTQTQLVL